MRQKLFYAVAVIILALTLIFFNRLFPVVLLRAGVIMIFQPVLEMVSVFGRRFSGGSGQSVTADAVWLMAENERLRVIEHEYQMLQDENAGLRKIVEFKEKQHVQIQGARILLRGNELGKEFLMLNEGVQKKIHEGNLVIDSRGAVVGIIREVNEGFAKVAIASNPGEAFEVTIAPLGVKALAKGMGNRTFSLELIPDNTPVRTGDFALMPDRLGNASAVIAEVTQVGSSGVGAFQNVHGTLLSRPETLDEVFVVLE